MASNTPPLAERLRRALDEAERQARAATAGPWRYNPGKQWLSEPDDARRALLALIGVRGEEFVGAGPLDKTIGVAATGDADDPQSMADAAHIARWDPSTALRLIERDRALLAQFEEAAAWYDANRSAPAGEMTGLRFALDQAAAFWLGERGDNA